MEPFSLISIHSDFVDFYCLTAFYRPLIDAQADAWSMYTPSLARRICLLSDPVSAMETQRSINISIARSEGTQVV